MAHARNIPSGSKGSDIQESGVGRGSQRPADRDATQQQGQGRGWVPQAQCGGYGGGRGGRGPHQQQYAPAEYQPGGGRGAAAPQHGGRGGYGGRGSFGREGAQGRPVPDLQQATPAVVPPEVAEQVSQLSVEETAPSQAIQPIAASSRSLRFPLRPGKGSTGARCIVQANHFFAELPDKDLHQ